MPLRPRLALLPVLLSATVLSVPAQDLRLTRAVSAPSGKLVGTEFVIDAPRNRFVYPQDRSFVVYFEWDAPPGDHALTANWRQPDGRVASISPDVRMVTTTRDLKCYWNYLIPPDTQPGVWTVEIRINGSPAGSHSFEIAGTVPSPPPAAPAPEPKPSSPSPPSLDQIFQSASRSVVSIHKLDSAGKRIDTGTGFLIAKDQVATAFQIIDGASSVQVEFPDAAVAATDKVLAFSRLGDWAVLHVDTADRPHLARDAADRFSVGADAIVFNAAADHRVIGGINIAGLTDVPGFGPRIHLSQPLGAVAVGGPLLTRAGLVAGIVGGSLVPGERPTQLSGRQALVPWSHSSMQAVAVPMKSLPDGISGSGSTMAQLLADGVFTPIVLSMPEIIYAGTAAAVSKKAQDPIPPTVSEFSRRDPQMWIFSLWKRQAKLSKGTFSARIYDAGNKVLFSSPPQKLSLSDQPTRIGFAIAPATLPPGVHRIDLFFDNKPVWRTFARLTD